MKPPPNGFPEQRPPACVVLLGASNLSLALPQAMRHAVSRLPDRRLSLYVAHGPGRSYGIDAGLAGVRFTGLSGCGLFRALEEEMESQEQTEGWALLTDVGNDILYRSGVDAILSWAGEIVERLRKGGLKVGVTSLPIASIKALPSWKYRLIRPLLFPFRPMPREEVLRQVDLLEEGLADIVASQGARLLPTRAEWYGADHIHLRKRCRAEATRAWLDGLLLTPDARKEKEDTAPEASNRLRVSNLRLRFHRPAEYAWFCRKRRRPQKGLRLTENARLYCY